MVNKLNKVERDYPEQKESSIGDALEVDLDDLGIEHKIGAKKDKEPGSLNKSFKEFEVLFDDLTTSRVVDTEGLDVENVIISAQSNWFIALVKDSKIWTHV